MDTKRELEFIGCAMTKRFFYETVNLAADRGYGVLVEPVGSENQRAFNLYQTTPALCKAAPELYEACKELVGSLTKALNKFPVVINAQTVSKADQLAREAIAKVDRR